MHNSNSNIITLRLLGVVARSGDFTEDSGKIIAYAYTQFHCLAPANGDQAVGSVPVSYKLKGTQHFINFKDLDFTQELQIALKFEFNLQNQKSYLVDAYLV